MSAHPYWSRTPGDGELWCDGFDADLLNVVPGAAETLGDLAGIELMTHGHLTNGRLNHPTVWNDYAGMGAYFWTPQLPELGKPAGYLTSDPVVACSFLEAIRDGWCHDCLIVVNRQPVWAPLPKQFQQLMYDARGWTRLADDERERVRRQVTESLEHAVSRLRSVLAGVQPERMALAGLQDDGDRDDDAGYQLVPDPWESDSDPADLGEAPF